MAYKKFLLSAALILSVAALAISTTQVPPSCHLQVIKDYKLGVTYRAVLRLSRSCELGTQLRVRKSSTTSTKRNGAPYQPIFPLTGAWELNRQYSGVPEGALWTMYNWKWQFWEPEAWNDRTQSKGRWLDAEVIDNVPNAP